MLWISSQTDDDQWTLFANCLWALWRNRNDLAYQGIQPSHETFCRYLNSISVESMVAASVSSTKSVPVSTSQNHQLHTIVCHTDGSWKEGWMGGIGYVFTENGTLKWYRSARWLLVGPLRAEARAVLEALVLTKSKGWEQFTICSDCQSLVSAVLAIDPPVDVDWRAFKEVYDIWLFLRLNPDINCIYVDRSQNALADSLAKRGRIRLGYPRMHLPNSATLMDC